MDVGRTVLEGDLHFAAQCSGGYPYLMQLIGFRMWAMSPKAENISRQDVEDGVRLARSDFERQVLQATYQDFSAGGVRFLEAMLPDAGASRLSVVAERMGVRSNYVSSYKTRLLEQGVIGERGRGRIGFELPYLRECVTKMRDEDQQV